MSITITVNSSPYAGQEGQKVTSNLIRERLLAEAEIMLQYRLKKMTIKIHLKLVER